MLIFTSQFDEILPSHLDLNLHPLISFHSPPIVLPGAPRIPLNSTVFVDTVWGSYLDPFLEPSFFFLGTVLEPFGAEKH